MKLIHATVCLLLAVMLLGPPVSAWAQGTAEPNDERTYGTTATTFLALTPWDFRPIDSTVTYEISTFFGIGRMLSRTNPTGSIWLEAPLHLPQGAVVNQIEAVFCDSTPSHGFSLVLVVQPRMGSASSFPGPSSTAAAAPGCVDVTTVLAPVQIDNNANSYQIEVALEPASLLVQLGSVRVGYRLQVSPAPAAATFNDVPTNHPFFPFIEALVAAGITTGCSTTPPLFCPDGAVTRKQMAAFISKALGLHWAP